MSYQFKPQTTFQSDIVYRIIQWWYPQSATKILKVIDKLRPPKIQSTEREAYLEFPEDSAEFPIEVTEDSEESLQDSIESDESSGSESEEDEEL